MISKHTYTGETFDSLFANFEEPKPQPTQSEFVKVASGCVSCPCSGNVSADACNACKYANGISFSKGDTYIKCAYQKPQMTKEASNVQGVHWENDSLVTQERSKQIYKEVDANLRSNAAEELKWAAHNIGVKLAREDIETFSKNSSSITGRELEKAARKYIVELQKKIEPALVRKNSGSLDQVFAMVDSPKTIVSSMSSPTVGDNNSAGCGYLGSKYNPNTIWNSNALTTAAQNPSNDEITKKARAKEAAVKDDIKKNYWAQVQEKLADQNLISSARVHSTSTEASAAFNSNLPANAIGIFGDNKEFKNIPAETVGEKLASQNKERASKKSEENKEVQIKSAETTESKNWLFK